MLINKMSTTASKIFWSFHGTMAVYGMTRGYRIEPPSNKPLLFTERVTSALMSGYVYGLPLMNLMYLKALSDRIEIHIRGFNRDLYKDSYKELSGVCDRTL